MEDLFHVSSSWRISLYMVCGVDLISISICFLPCRRVVRLTPAHLPTGSSSQSLVRLGGGMHLRDYAIGCGSGADCRHHQRQGPPPLDILQV